MCKVSCIVLLLKLIAKTQSIVIFFPRRFDVSFPVCDVFTTSAPGMVIAFATEKYLHTVLVRRIAFEEIQDVKGDSSLEAVVMNSEEEPLGAFCAINVLMEQHVVLILFLRFSC